jgi:maleate isomerase
LDVFVRVSSLGIAVSDALGKAKAERIAVITPYNEDLTRSVVAAIKKDKREIVAACGMGITVNVELSDPTPENILCSRRKS